MPRLNEKKACPIALRKVVPVTLPKSGFNRNSMPEPAPGSEIEQPTKIRMMMNKAGIIIFEDFSMPFSTPFAMMKRSEEHTSELQSRQYLVCRLLLEKKKKN